MAHPIVVTGEPGAGKTTLVARLAREIGVSVALPGGVAESRRIDAQRYQRLGIAVSEGSGESCIVETCAYGDGWTGYAALVIVVVDAVAPDSVDPQLLTLADLVVLSRGDLVDPTPVYDAIAQHCQVPVREAPHGALEIAGLPAGSTRRVSLPARAAMACWGYAGAARLNAALAERLLTDRPAGVTRIKGIVFGDATGLEVDRTGRARSVTPCAAPEETMLFAAGALDSFQEQDMALHFAEIASAGAARAGWFGFR